MLNEEETVKELLRTHTNKGVSEKIGKSTRAVSDLRKKHGIPTPFGPGHAARKFTVNEAFFKAIDTEEKAYALGFIAADGCVSHGRYSRYLTITLHEKDEDILIKLRDSMEATYPVKSKFIGNKSGYPGSHKKQSELIICSRTFVDHLEDQGITANKASTVEYPFHIPRNLDRHYLRGLFDGDGSISHDAFGVVVNETMAKQIPEILNYHGLPFLRYVTANNYPSLRAFGRSKRLLKWMYEDASIYLDRKYSRYCQWWKERPASPYHRPPL